MSNFFVSVDTYEHQPRKFFGLVKDNSKPIELRPATITIFCESGLYKSFNFNSAKIGDDDMWDGNIINPADYGHPAKDNDIAIGIHEWTSKQTDESPMYWFSNEKERLAVQAFFARVWNVSYPFPQSLIEIFEEQKAKEIPDEIFSGEDYTIAINKQEWQKEYNPEQKLALLQSHRRYPYNAYGDMSLQKAHKMYLLFKLLQSIK